MKTSIIRLLFFVSIFVFNYCDSVVPNKISKVQNNGFCLTFDDKYLEDWVNIIELLDSNNVNATFFISTNKLSTKEVALLDTLRNHNNEIGCHTAHHYHPLEFIENHSLQEYLEVEIFPQIKMMNKVGIYPTSFSYPYGENDSTLDGELLKYFDILRDVTDEQRKPLEKQIDKIDEIFCENENTKLITGLGIDENFNISIEQIEEAFKRVKRNNEIIVLYCHQSVKDVSRDYQVSFNYLRELFKLAKKYNLRSYTVSYLKNISLVNYYF